MDQISRAEEFEQKRSYWKQHIDNWQETDLTQAEYCRRHNLKHHQLVYWKKRFLRTETGVSFVPLKLDDMLMDEGERAFWNHPRVQKAFPVEAGCRKNVCRLPPGTII